MNKIHTTYMGPREKAIIFVQSINDAKYLAPKFGNLVSHSSIEAAEKMENEHRWMNGQDYWCIVASTGMIHGVDHPAVSAVIFAGFPYNIINMIQGAGRGGRGGNKTIAVIVEHGHVNITMVEHRTGGDGDPQCLKESEKWLANSDLCHRVIISNLMDGIPHTCQDLAQIYPHVEYCNICNPGSPLFAGLFQVYSTMKKGKAKAILSLPPTPPQPIQISSNSDDEYDQAFSMEQLANLDFSQLEGHYRSSSQSSIPSLPVWSNPASPVPTTSNKRAAPSSSIDLPPPKRIHSNLLQGSHHFGQPASSAQSQTRRHSSVSRKVKTSSLSRSYPSQQNNSANASLPVLMDVAYARSLKEMKNKKAIILNELCNKLNNNCKACWVLGKENVTPPCSRPFIDCRVDDGFSQLGFGWIGLRKLVDLPGNYQYCFQCWLPQSTKGKVAWLPESHPPLDGSKDCGGLKDSVILLVWFIRHNEGIWNEAVAQFHTTHNLPANPDLEEFGAWLGKEANSLSCFTNAVELIIWYYCKVGIKQPYPFKAIK
ncbi:hypothetical protein BDN71DRAFT_1428215 [Pleurotus eryngii]|uniref:Helicase C-terminal domain-containing protein n=1 Tax=Pleurotus eryngii TaxID=5323 RepID=A0A9P6A4M4_PLEER|nr:hypothetical protein BDN71DRAFT_1428215 [Pleurotus eryngii]